MFYSQFILAKKGPLGTIWIAAHLERKLRKNQVADTDIGVSVDSILFPDVPIALRLSSHLLLGVVRIYSRKVNYLFHDCSEALVKVKQAFRSTAVDLPPEESTAPYHSITLPETFDLDDFELPDSETFQGNYVDHHISSKEQITLQDTMDGVVYSTSQFGLDERFGDGDTSQIRLDLDEELFLDKVATPGHTVVLLERNSVHPRVSGQPMTPFSTMDMDEDENNLGEERMAGASEDMPATAKLKHFDSNSQDQYISPLRSGDIDDSNLNNKDFPSERPTPYPSKDLSELPPSTPRLEAEVVLTNGHVEDPKLNLVNETSASSSVDVVMQDATCNLQMESENCKQIELAGEENLENHRSRQDIHVIEEASVPAVVATDSISSEVRHSISSPTSVLAEQSKAISPPSECLDSTLAVPSIEGSTLILQGGIASDKKTGFSEADQDQGNGVEDVSDVVVEPINSEGVARQRISFDTAAAETLVEGSATESTKNYHSVSEDISNGKLASHKASSEQQAFTEVGLVHDPCTPSPADSLLRSVDAYGKVELKDGSEPENLKAQNHVLLDGRQCTLEDGEECHPIGVKDAGLEANKILVPCEGANVGSPSNIDGNLDNVISKDIREENGSVSCDVAVPAPEILLSATLGIRDPPSDLRGMSIPEREVSAEHEVSDEGSKILSGRKRQFVENTPIPQDVNAAKLSVVPRSKRFKDSIPDDDDLLSSILVGRRSSALKLKPTPMPLEVAYGKRPRGTSRVSVPKRKVLMDDTLVLHGDTIRQQLTSTEDIRRLRKKAPCTRPEIWMIQKHLLEDEVFVEPLFTGMSEDLIGLHDRTYYLTEFRVSRDNVKQELSRVPDNVKISGITSPIGETNLEERAAPAPIGNDSEVHTTSANHHNSIDCNAQQQKDAPSDVLALDLPVDGPVAEGTAMEIEKLDNEVTDIADHVGNWGIVSTSPAVHVPRDKCDIASDTVMPSLPLDVSNGAQTPLQNEGNMDTQFDEKDGDKTNCEADDAVIVAQVIEEGSALGVSTVMDESFTQSITESGLVDQVPENYMQEPRDSICGPASRQDVSVTKDDSLKQKASESGIIDAVPQKREGDMCGSVDGCGSSLAEGVSTAKDEAAIVKISESGQFDMSGRPLSSITAPMDNRLLENGADVCVERDASVVVEDCEALRSELGIADGDVSLGKLKDAEAKSNAKLIETRGNSSCPLDFNQDVSQGDNLSSKENILDAEAATPVNAAMNEAGDFGNTLDENHTEFLNFDDEEAIEEADTSIPSADEARILDNSGWSSRTRAVAKYLQTLFDDEPEHARKVLPMENLLSGKTRKEASRMFFETLVLKTRDYVKVQQDNPFATISIKPTGKLLKSDF